MVWCALSHSSPPRRYVSDPDTDTADTLNDALSAGLHLVISPGIYTLSAPLVVEKENQRTNALTRGVVARHLTSKPFHPRGVKVLLESSIVRVDSPSLRL